MLDEIMRPLCCLHKIFRFALHLHLHSQLEQLLFVYEILTQANCYEVGLYLKLGAFKAMGFVQGFINELLPTHCVHYSDHNRCLTSCKQDSVGIVNVFLPEVSLAPSIGIILAQLAACHIAAQIPAEFCDLVCISHSIHLCPN